MQFLKPKFWENNKISVFAIFLLPITFLIKLINFLKKKFIKGHNFEIPIICVGNIYLGGTGKTPFCIKLFSILKSLNKNPAFIRKKYKLFQDEINLLKKTGPTYENHKRKHAISNAIKNNMDVAILDDGYQDFSIKKNLSIVCFNEKQWIGNGFIIPSGPLRESLSALKRANLVIINGKKNTRIEETILKKNSLLKIFYTAYNPININEFINKKIIAFAGIGAPENFFHLLKDYNIDLIEEIKFPDHYNYSNKHLEDLISKKQKNNATLLTTEKDYFRINEKFRKNINYLKIDLRIENESKLINELHKII